MSVEETVHEKSLGEILVNYRDKLGLSQSDIAQKLHISRQIIDDIEHNHFSGYPSVFLKGYIKSYADIVGLEASVYAPYLELFRNTPPITVMKNYSSKEQRKRSGKRLLLLGLIFVVIAVGAVVFFTWKNNQNELVEVSHYISPSLSKTLIDS